MIAGNHFSSFPVLNYSNQGIKAWRAHGLVGKSCRWTEGSSPVLHSGHAPSTPSPCAAYPAVGPSWVFSALIAKGKNSHDPAGRLQTPSQHARPSLPQCKRKRRWEARPWTQTRPALDRLLSLSQYLTPGQSLLTCFIYFFIVKLFFSLKTISLAENPWDQSHETESFLFAVWIMKFNISDKHVFMFVGLFVCNQKG